MSTSTRKAPLPPIALGLAAVALGHALEIQSGHVNPFAIAWLTVSIALAAVAVGLPHATLPFDIKSLERLLGAGLFFELFELARSPPGAAATFVEPATLAPFHAALAVAAVLAAVIVFGPAPLSRRTLGPLLILHLAMGAWLIHNSPNPIIDVFAIHRQSLDGFLRGGNPYALTFPNIYPTTIMYGPAQVIGDRLNFGYCYPPIDLWMALPGHVLFGDYRYSYLLCISLSAASIGALLPGRRATIAAALLLFTPRIFYVVEHGWTDPVVALLLCATVICAVRAPRLLPIALGLMLVAKQYTPLVVPAVVVLLLANQSIKQKKTTLLAAAAIGLAVTLPFVAWDPRRFLWDVVTLQFHSPFRADALSYLAFVASLGGPRLPSLVGFVAALFPIALSLHRGARTAASFAAAAALTLLVFFAFNKQAFCNYYYLCIATFCCAAAAWPGGDAPCDHFSRKPNAESP